MKGLLLSLFMLVSFWLAGNNNTISTGDWENPTIWSTGSVPDQFSQNFITISAGDSVHASYLIFDKAVSITVEPGAILIVDSSLTSSGVALEVKNNLTLYIATDAVFKLNGDFVAKNNSTLTVDGSLTITGDLSVGNGATLLGEGSVTVEGEVIGPVDFVNDSQLPVELLSFDMYVTGDRLIFDWITLTETNSEHFELLRSINGKDWTLVETIQSAGNSVTQIRYSISIEMLGGYYKLKQVDYDGNFAEYNNLIKYMHHTGEAVTYYGLDGRYLINPHGVYFSVNKYNVVKIFR